MADLLQEAIDWLKNPQRTQQVQGIGSSLENTINSLLAARKQNNALWEQAFGNPKKPLEITDKKAFQELSQKALENVTGFIPAGIFVGVGSKTWNKTLADKFLELEKQGFSPEELWKQTRTFRSPDGNLKQEVSDVAAKFRTNFEASGANKSNNYKAGIEGPIGGMVEHSDLFKAYPDLLTKLRYTLSKQAEWLPDSVSTGQYSRTFGGNERISTNTKTEEDALSKLIHELQHAIQTREKWQSGGTESRFKDLPGLSAFEQYQRLAGEAEARAAQARRTMTSEQRINTFPLSNYDVPIESLIYKDPFGSTLK